jgi:hypothetical protein
MLDGCQIGKHLQEVNEFAVTMHWTPSYLEYCFMPVRMKNIAYLSYFAKLPTYRTRSDRARDHWQNVYQK